ncbi:MAG: substrate-binding periplasmic protein [Pseudomonadota bacterium]
MRLSLLLLLLLLPAVPTVAGGLCDRPLVVNVGDWRPYTWRLANGDAGGIDIDVLRRAAARLQCRLAFVEVPPERAHPLLEEGRIDILLAASDLPERRRYAWFSAPYRQEVMAVLAARPPQPAPSSLTAVADSTVILLAPRFGWYGRDYARDRATLQDAGQLQLFDDYAQGIAMLAAGRGGLILGDERALQYEARAQGLSLRRLFVTNASPVHLMFSRRTFGAADVARFNAALGAALPAASAAPGDRATPAGKP